MLFVVKFVKISEFLKKIQNLPESKKKIILWSIVIIVGFFIFVLWIKNTQEKLKSFPKGESKIPSLKQQLEGLPRIEMPEISEEELKKLEEELKKSETATTKNSNEPR